MNQKQQSFKHTEQKGVSYLEIPFSDGATNGDMIRALFPNAKIKEFVNCIETNIDYTTFSAKWWDAPYKKEGDAE